MGPERSGDEGSGGSNGRTSTGNGWLRLLLSIALASLPIVGQLVPMPGVDFPSGGREAMHAQTSLYALGVSSLLSAYLSVELGALLVPRWRRLRHGMPEGRRRLKRAAGTLAIILAAFQAFGVGMMLEASGLARGVNLPILIASLSAATSVMVLLAGQIDRLGVLNGVLALLLAESACKIVRAMPTIQVPDGALQWGALVCCVVLPVLVTWLSVRAFAPIDDSTRSKRSPFSLPASSLQPAQSAESLQALSSTLLKLAGPLTVVLAPLNGFINGPFQLEARLGIALSLTVLFAFLLQQPQIVKTTLQALEPERPTPSKDELVQSLASALVPSCAFTVVLVVCDEVAGASLPTPLAPFLVLATALAMDARRALRTRRAQPDLVCVAEERRPYALSTLLAAAERAGVSLQATGVATTSLLRVFGPYAAIRLWCQAPEAARASQVLAEIYERREATATAGTATPALRHADWNGAARSLVWLGALAAALHVWFRFEGLGPTLAAAAASSARPDNETTQVSGALEVLLVDDEAELFSEEAQGIPAGLAILPRYLFPRTGSKDYPVRRSYARLVLQNGETLDEALRRIEPWLARFPLPEGRRLAWGELDDETPGSGVFTSYLLVSDRILAPDDFEKVTLGRGPEGQPFVGWQLNREGAARLRDFTAQHTDERMALLSDGVVLTAPKILAEISNGYMQLSLGSDDPDVLAKRARVLFEQMRGR